MEVALSLFRLDASMKVDGSHSRSLADVVEEEWRALNPDAEITRRDIGTEPLPSDAFGLAAHAGVTPEAGRSPAQLAALALAATLTDELDDADALLFAVPLFNFGVSQHFKTWVDLVITDPRMAAGSEPVVAGKPAVLATVRGGAYGAGTPREGWDHATPWMRRILEDVWQLDLEVVEKEFTLVGIQPALDPFKDMAAAMHAEAEDLARKRGRFLGKARYAA